MKQQTIMWTAIPRGYSESGRLVLTVFVSPQLKTDVAPETLGQFQDFVDWPATLAKLSFQVDFGGALRDAKRPSDESDSKLWTALFTKDTYVRPYKFEPFDNRLIFSYPVKHVLDFLKEKYQKYAIGNPENFPGKESLAVDFAPVSFFRPDIRGTTTAAPQQVDQTIANELRKTMGRENAMPPGPPNPALDFFQLKWFHTPKNKRTPDTPVMHNNKPAIKQGMYQRAIVKPPEIDFHQAVSSLGNYPNVLRTMGLVFDLEIEAAPAVPPSSTVRVIPQWSAGLPSLPKDDKTPKTQYIRDAKRFVARPRASEPEVTEAGLMRLRDENPILKQNSRLYSLVQVDVDGMAIKTMNFAYNMFAAETRRTLGTPNHSSLPSIRSAGVSVVRTGRALRLARHLKGATQRRNDLVGGTEPTLSAEDLVRGYRMDVYDVERGKWYSLCRRIGRYEFTRTGQVETLEDEGIIQTGVTGSADDTTNDLYLPEQFATWEGWSLAAPRPGAAINNDGVVERSPNEFSEEFKLRASFRAQPGSLPMLRFGRKYRIRIRAVDLAGGGPTVDGLDPSDFGAATDELMYSRFEPVSNPFIVLKNSIADSPGEDLERVVIRSLNKEIALDTVPTEQTSDRHVAPPTIAALSAETHGMFDLSADKMTDENLKKQYDLIASKEGRFKATGPIDVKSPPNPIDTSEIIVDLPYLPDPIAAGAVFFNLPGVPAGKVLHIHEDGSQNTIPLVPAAGALSLTKIEFRRGDEWHKREAFRIRLKEGPAGTPPSWDNGGRVLTVYAAKADVYRCRYASFLGGMNDLEIMGIWGWIREKAPANLADLQRQALDGRHWMLTPFRTLELVHATQQPLGIPAFTGLQADKTLGATFATLLDKVLISGKSASKVDVYAEWKEPVDPLGEPEWKTIDGKARVCEVRVDDPKATVIYLDNPHEFGDTKHRIVRYRASATTRFRELMPEELTKHDPSDPGRVERNLSRSSETVEKNVLSSARPDVPKLLYIVPTFGWESNAGAGGSKASKRIGGGLRIWMDRPWFSSGEGELLGVLIWTGTFDSIPEKFKPYVTQWGVDPIWQSGATSSGPGFNDFKGWHHDQLDITLDELTTGLTLGTFGLVTATQFLQQGETKTKANIEVLKNIEGFDAKAMTQKNVQETKTTIKAADQYLQNVQATRTEAEITKKIQDADIASKAHEAKFKEALGGFKLAKPTLAVVGHKVEYDKGRGLWYCDIQIDAGKSYYPFVRLALVRYQPDSVPNAFVSRVVLADFAQLAPDRTVGIIPDPANPKRIVVAVSGVTYKSSEASKGGSEIEVTVETRRPDVNDPELGWAPVPDANIELVSRPFNDTDTLWGGTITLPEPRGSRPYRLVIKEYEKFIQMSVSYSTAASTVQNALTSRRVVFADVVEV